MSSTKRIWGDNQVDDAKAIIDVEKTRDVVCRNKDGCIPRGTPRIFFFHKLAMGAFLASRRVGWRPCQSHPAPCVVGHSDQGSAGHFSAERARRCAWQRSRADAPAWRPAPSGRFVRRGRPFWPWRRRPRRAVSRRALERARARPRVAAERTKRGDSKLETKKARRATPARRAVSQPSRAAVERRFLRVYPPSRVVAPAPTLPRRRPSRMTAQRRLRVAAQLTFVLHHASPQPPCRPRSRSRSPRLPAPSRRARAYTRVALSTLPASRRAVCARQCTFAGDTVTQTPCRHRPARRILSRRLPAPMPIPALPCRRSPPRAAPSVRASAPVWSTPSAATKRPVCNK